HRLGSRRPDRGRGCAGRRRTVCDRAAAAPWNRSAHLPDLGSPHDPDLGYCAQTGGRMRRLEKTIREIGWTHAVPRLDVGDRVSRAFEEMSREAHDCVLVVRDGALAGIFTSRDFVNRIAAVRADPAKTLLGDVMTPTPRTLRPRDPVVFA